MKWTGRWIQSRQKAQSRRESGEHRKLGGQCLRYASKMPVKGALESTCFAGFHNCQGMHKVNADVPK